MFVRRQRKKTTIENELTCVFGHRSGSFKSSLISSMQSSISVSASKYLPASNPIIEASSNEQRDTIGDLRDT